MGFHMILHQCYRGGTATLRIFVVFRALYMYTYVCRKNIFSKKNMYIYIHIYVYVY